jgi:hypothetical protein
MSYFSQLPIASGIEFPYSGQNIGLDLNVLKNGTEQDKYEQLQKWKKGTDPSLFIQWIPDEMTEEMARSIFATFGLVDRVEFVPKFDQNRKQIGRMLFVHFEMFYGTDFENRVVEAHPEPYELRIDIKTERVPKKYFLKCRVNIRPIPKVEYTTSQLTDMFEGLNSRVLAQLTDMQRQLDDLRAENQFLLHENTEMVNRIYALEKW